MLFDRRKACLLAGSPVFCTRLPCSTDDEFPVIAEQGISSEMPENSEQLAA
jgi:hypothetical protein